MTTTSYTKGELFKNCIIQNTRYFRLSTLLTLIVLDLKLGKELNVYKLRLQEYRLIFSNPFNIMST